MTLTTAAPADQLTESDDVRRRELAAFLRSRRERISPHQVGVAFTGRRRTPGLRREEVAQLSGVGVTWYTWLEQGRDIKVSEQVLSAIARTLMLDPDERGHLFTLAGASDQNLVIEGHAVTPQLRATLAKLNPYPACVVSGKYDLLAYNPAYNQLMTDFDALPVEERNCMLQTFTDPVWKERVVDWEDAAARMVANLRGLMADHVGDASWDAIVVRLRKESTEFAEMWARHEVRGIENKTKYIRHPLGMLKFDTMHTWLAPRAGRRMMVYVPADADTERRTRVWEELG